MLCQNGHHLVTISQQPLAKLWSGAWIIAWHFIFLVTICFTSDRAFKGTLNHEKGRSHPPPPPRAGGNWLQIAFTFQRPHSEKPVFWDAQGQLTRLKALNLKHCHRLTGASIAALSRLKALEDLNLTKCWMVTDESLGELAQLQKLSALRMNGCDQISVAGGMSLLNSPCTSFLIGWDMMSPKLFAEIL